MKIAVMTTQTPHHAYFVRELERIYGQVRIFCETEPPPPPGFETAHPFEAERDRVEARRWFDGTVPKLGDLAETGSVRSMNDPEAVKMLREAGPDVVVVFGTGLLKPRVIDLFPDRLFNLHGGDPEEYRGLDTHLWAIYHRDFAGLVTTMHRVDPELDTGDIVVQGALPLSSIPSLAALRAVNTEVCLKLTTATLDMFARNNGAVATRPQKKKGRYYSAMPAVLKEVCLSHFDKYLQRSAHVAQ